MSWLISKDPDAGKDGRWEKGRTGRDGWMASLTQWTCVCVNSRSWWWTGRPGLLQSMGSQRVGHDWATELNCHQVAAGLPCGRWASELFSDIWRQVRNPDIYKKSKYRVREHPAWARVWFRWFVWVTRRQQALRSGLFLGSRAPPQP